LFPGSKANIIIGSKTMRSEIIYVELKVGHNDDGPAWIGKGFFNRTGNTVYFNGQIFKKGKGISGNHFDLNTGDEYWISGVKKNGTDRHWAGSGSIDIDESIVEEYLELRGLAQLTKGKYKLVKLINQPAKELSNEIENQKLELEFDEAIRFKKISDLTSPELEELIIHYQQLDLTNIPKKGRKEYIDKLNELIVEFENRKTSTAPSNS